MSSTDPAIRTTASKRATLVAILVSVLFVVIGYPLASQVVLPDHGHHIRVQLLFLLLVIALVCTYLVRHYVFTFHRLFGHQRTPYLDVDVADWPTVTVLVPAHDEETVIARVLDALLLADYPTERISILVVDDRSTDRTGEIVGAYTRQHPGLVRVFHRTEGPAGKAAALRDAMEYVHTDVMLVFDADYVPGRGLVKQLVAPFFDPEVGAVMGRVVPVNTGRNLLTRLLDLERSGGYQVDQQARMNLGLVPQYGGTVGGVRKRALEAVGGWNIGSLAEDTDATFRLLLGGWKTVYQNRSECYEEVPERWPDRMRQVVRWARGHNQCLFRYSLPLLTCKRVTFWEKLDGLLLLGIYVLSPILVFGWAAALSLWYLGINRPDLILILAVSSYSVLGNFATFFEVAAATHLDRTRQRARLLPFLFFGFLITVLSVTQGAFVQLAALSPHRRGFWHKTARQGESR